MLFQFHSVPKQTKMASGLTMFRDENWMRLLIEVNLPFGGERRSYYELQGCNQYGLLEVSRTIIVQSLLRQLLRLRNARVKFIKYVDVQYGLQSCLDLQ